MLYLHLICASVSKMCPKVYASSLYTTSAYERFHKNILLSKSGGNLYRICIMILQFKKKIRNHQYRVVKGSMVYPILIGKNEIELYELRGYNLQDPLGEKGNKNKIHIIRSLLF